MYIDFETVGRHDLKRVGAYKYLRDADILHCVAIRGNECFIIRPMFPVKDDTLKRIKDTFGLEPKVVDEPPADDVIVGHNIFEFDRILWEREDWPLPQAWEDTMYEALYFGLPGGLDALGMLLFDEGKDLAGSAAIKRAQTKGGNYLKLAHDLILFYCVKDVVLTKRLHEWIQPLVKRYLPDAERRQWEINHRLNSAGICIDKKLAEAIIASEQEAKRRSAERAGMSQEALRSWKKVIKALHELGVYVPDTRRYTLETWMDDPELPDEAILLMQARLNMVRIAEKKALRALEAAEGDHVYGLLRYYGAHTGRAASQLVQIHNLPRAPKKFDYEDARRRVLAGEALPPDQAAALLRAMIVPDHDKVVMCDFSSIEARTLAWMAGEEEVLDIYRAKADLYKITAAQILGKKPEDVTDYERQLGKIVVLACGYQMGPERFGAVCQAFGVDPRKVGLTEADMIFHFRKNRPKLAGVPTGKIFEGRPCFAGGFWKNIEKCMVAATPPFERVEHDRYKAVACKLPSGRYLFYRDFNPDARTYRNRYGNTVNIYGGKITENLDQAISRDIAFDAVAAALDAGIDVRFHVHDEIVAYGDEDALHTLEEIMRQSPEWADNLPIDCEGKIVDFYQK